MYSNKYDLCTNNVIIPNATGTHSDNVRVNRFAFTAPECPFKTGKARNAFDTERAITDTIKYLGFMSLKNGDHAGDKKDVTQATAQRAAADRLIAAGTVVLLGTWSNGIAVGPGVGFSAVTNEPEVIAPVKPVKVESYAAKKAAATKRMKAQAAKTLAPNHCPSIEDYIAEPETAPVALHGWHSEWCAPGASCAVTLPWPNAVGFVYTPDTGTVYDGDCSPWSPDVMHGPAFVAKPRVRVPLATMQAPAAVAPVGNPPGLKFVDGPYTATEIWYMYCDTQREQEPAQPATTAPTPIYTPAVGDTIQICYQHERMTTDRIVNVQRVAADGKTFRGYDRTYDRVRNYDMARVVTIRRLGGEGVDIAAG